MGLLGTMAKTAVVSGTATATRSAINRRQANKNVAAYSHAEQQVQGQPVQYAQRAPAATAPAPAPATAGQDDTISQLERLGKLKDQGVLTEQEFEDQKAKILGT
jgi:hypothetical protein